MIAGWDRWTRLTAVVLAVLALYAVVVFRDYGLSWDEEHSALNGIYAVEWFRTLGDDDHVITAVNQRLYGSAFNLVSALAASISPLGPYETSHLLIAILGWTALLYAARLAALVGGSRAGFFAMLTLALTPPFVGHAFMNPKDIPLATLFVVSAFYLVRASSELPTPTGRTLRRLAVTSGLAAGTRVIGTFLLVYWGLAIAVWWLTALAGRRPRPRLLTIAGWWWKPALGAWLVMVVCWPYAQLDPIRNPVRAFLDVSRFQWPGGTMFDGHHVPGHDLPWYYLPTWFGISLPELYAAAFTAAIVPGIAFLVAEGRGRRWRAVACTGFLLMAAVAPPALATWHHAVFYDGMRHFLFVLPFVAVLAGCALSAGSGELAAFATRRTAWTAIRAALALVPVAAALVSAALTVADMYALHPYEYVYFNRLVAGGQAAASERFETDYWGLSYKEGLEWLRANYPRGSGRVTVANCSTDFLTSYWIRNDPELAERFIASSRHTNPPPRILLATTRYNCHRQDGRRILHVVTRKNVPLMYVLEREP